MFVISGTLVSRTAMLDALEYKINVSSHMKAHGGFSFEDQSLGVTTVGAAREPINAWLPLYITKSHWDRVKVGFSSVSYNTMVWHYLPSMFNPFPKQTFVFMCLQYKSFENAVGKREISHNKQVLLFPQYFLQYFSTVFSTRLENFLPFLSNLKLSSETLSFWNSLVKV